MSNEVKPERTLVSGMYRCRDCGATVSVTTMEDVRRLGAMFKSEESFYRRCPKCYVPGSHARSPMEWNTYERLGFWDTFKIVARRMWSDDNGS